MKPDLTALSCAGRIWDDQGPVVVTPLNIFAVRQPPTAQADTLEPELARGRTCHPVQSPKAVR
jgi:hypothetical protein